MGTKGFCEAIYGPIISLIFTVGPCLASRNIVLAVKEKMILGGHIKIQKKRDSARQRIIFYRQERACRPAGWALLEREKLERKIHRAPIPLKKLSSRLVEKLGGRFFYFLLFLFAALFLYQPKKDFVRGEEAALIITFLIHYLYGPLISHGQETHL